MESLPGASTADGGADLAVRDDGDGLLGRDLPEPTAAPSSVLVERIEGRGGNRVRSDQNVGTVENSNGKGERRGDLLGSDFLAPMQPVNLANVPLLNPAENPGVRRVEVNMVDGAETQGEPTGPVPDGRALTYPVGVPQVYGPPVVYPPYLGNPGMNVGNGVQPQTPLRQVEGMGRVGPMSGNPFWSPDARALYEGHVGEGHVEWPEVAATPGMTQLITPGSLRPEGFVTRMDPVDLFRARNVAGHPETPEVVMDPVELFRLRCLREAEQKFAQGIAQMKSRESQDQGTGSYRSALSGEPKVVEKNLEKGKSEKPGDEGLVKRPPGLDDHLKPPVLGKGKGVGATEGRNLPKVETQQNDGMGPPKDGMGKPQNGNGGGLQPPTTGWGRDFLGEVSTETLRTVELPPLPQDANPITFGDWLAVVEPIMADISYSSGNWWLQVMMAVKEAYETWLTESPLGRLKLQVSLPTSALAWPRTEKRAVSMLLQALPEKLRLEMISSRKLTTHQIMFRLYCLFQPGGQAERSNLLHLLTDFKIGTNVGDHAQSIRQWIRWLARCEELNLVPPDPMVLSGVLGRVSDGLSKTGPQLGFRLSSIRQDLQLDNRPSMDEIRLFADFLLAEAEEMALNSSQGQNLGKPSVKSLNPQEPREVGQGSGGNPLNAAAVTSKTPCRFWMSEEGCKKADKCRYVHSFIDPKENRCFLCSATGHGKRECPYGGKPKIAKTQNARGTRKQETDEGKGRKGNEKGVSGKGNPGKSESVSPDSGPNPPVGNTPKENDLKSEGSGTNRGMNAEIGNILNEASELMKSLRPSVKMIGKRELLKKASSDNVATGLLDGGATNALRKGSEKEIRESTVVTVELAKGTATLFQDPITGTLYSEAPVEPIVPLRGIVNLGFKIKWDSKGCTIHHPTHGKLSCWLRNGCPVVRESHALKLIYEIEEFEREKNSKPKLASEKVSSEVKKWWLDRFPQVPESVVDYMVGQDMKVPQGSNLPWNRGVRRRVDRAKAIIIHLFSGKGNEWKKGWPEGVEVLTLDVRENPQQNLHDPHVWSYLIHVVKTKNVVGIVGGPPCRTVSRLRNTRPGPNPLRGRLEHRFGLPSLSEKENR